MSLQTGQRLAQTTLPIIDPRQLVIVAFGCAGPTLDGSEPVIHTSDIREVSDLGFIVDDSDVIMEADELVRLKEVIEFRFPLLHIPVIDSAGKRLGKVVRYLVDINSFYVTKLIVKRPLMQSFSDPELNIDRRQIIEITNQRIVVQSATVVVDEQRSSDQPRQPVNPFRSSPQPE